MKIEDAAQAEELLRALAEFYREPVMPISRYCNALETWVGCIQMNNGLYPSGMRPEGFAMPDRGDGHGASYVAILPGMLKDLRKSNLLYRLLYRGQPLRKRPCPQHRGHWSGWSKDPCPHGCSDGMNLTGWLPEPEPELASEKPKSERRPRIEYKDLEGKPCSLVLPPEGGFLGRVPDNLIPYPDIRMSRRQCKFILREDGFWYVEDTQSTGGTYLNEQRFSTATRLHPGDVIRVANMEFRYVE